MTAYDFIVIGGGSGGLAAAQRAAEHGARTLLFEPGKLGGTCVNVGCVPKKIMWTAAQLADALDEAHDYGFDLTIRSHDWSRLRKARDDYVAWLNGIYARNLERRGVELVRRRARFRAPGELEDSVGKVYRAEHVLIATGGHPKVPNLTGAELGITSDGFFELDRCPRRVAIVGSGYVAVEFAGVLRSLGAQVMQFVRFDRVLRSFDTMLSAKLMQEGSALGVEFVVRAVPHSVRHTGQLSLATEDGRQFDDFDCLIWAIGRDPNTRDLGLEHVGIALGDTGHIAVDEYQTTNVPGHYAVGDVTGQAELTPVAIAAGRRLAERVFGGQSERHLDYHWVPTVLFGHPPIGTVGLSEQAARARHPDSALKIYTSEFVPLHYALSQRRPKTAMKLIALGPDERIIGCHIIGPGADEMLQGFAVAISMGACKSDFDNTIAIHPTSAEELVTMR